jgi:hypothetical protein
MHSCLFNANDEEHQRRVCPMKKGETKHGTLIIWILPKDLGYLKITKHFCLNNIKAADNRAHLQDIFNV